MTNTSTFRTGDRPLAVITGGAGDIGRATARALLADDVDCVLVDLVDPERGAEIARLAAPSSPGASASYAQVDITDAAALADLFAALPRVDVAVCNAGIVKAQPFLEVDAEVWRRQLDVNLTGSFLTAQAAARRMVADGTPGSIVYVSSWVATRPWPEIVGYATSKAGVEQLMRQTALELSPHGIKANAVSPGIVKAGMAKVQYDTEPGYAERAARSSPLGIMQEADDIAQAVAFLASPRARTMTGSVLLIDSGCSLGTL